VHYLGINPSHVSRTTNRNAYQSATPYYVPNAGQVRECKEFAIARTLIAIYDHWPVRRTNGIACTMHFQVHQLARVELKWRPF